MQRGAELTANEPDGTGINLDCMQIQQVIRLILVTGLAHP